MQSLWDFQNAFPKGIRLKSNTYQRISFAFIEDVFEECEVVYHDGHVHRYRKLIVRTEHEDFPKVVFLMDQTLENMEYFSIHSWSDDVFQSEFEVQYAVTLTKQFISQKFCVIEALRVGDKYCGSGLNSPTGLPLSLDKQATKLRRCFLGKEPTIEKVDFSRYVLDETNQLFFEKGFVSEFGLAKCSTELGAAIDRQTASFAVRFCFRVFSVFRG